MNTSISKIFMLLTILISANISAQQEPGNYIKGIVGIGISAPYDESNISGSGFYAQVEYVHTATKWLSLRPYAGIILTSTSTDENQQNSSYKVTSNAFLLGGKARIAAPIPYFAPYIETGLGTSIGSFATFTETTNISKKGLIFHIPFSIGVAIGKKHKVDIAFTYYYHKSVEQFAGAAAFGLTFPLK